MSNIREDSKKYHSENLVIKPKIDMSDITRERIAREPDIRKVTLSVRTDTSLAEAIELFRREVEGKGFRRFSLSQICENLLIDGLKSNGVTYSQKG